MNISKVKPIYLDYMATTPIDQRVIEKMLLYMGEEGIFGNPSSATHCYGQQAMEAVEFAREALAKIFYVNGDSFVFTSGATEANNLALLGAARHYQRKGRHIVTMQTEHRSVLDPLRVLENEGYTITYLAPQADGLLDLNCLESALRDDTILVSIMHVNNETGVIQDIAAVGNLLQQRGILFHVDAAQSAGKLAINLQQLNIDLMSFSAHKIYGPKGVGALYIRQKPRIRLLPILWGGGQQRGIRAGTLPVHQIVGLSHALVLADAVCMEEQQRLLSYREKVWQNIQDLPGVQLNGHQQKRIAGNLNVSFLGYEGESLRSAMHDLAVSSTSACASLSHEPSYVLRAMGYSLEHAHSAIRFSFGRFTSEDDINKTIETIRGVIV